MAMRTVFLLLIGIIPMVGAPRVSLGAQGGPSRLQGKALGGSIDRFSYEDVSITAFTFRYSGLRPGGLGPEVGVSLFPQGLPLAALILAPDFGGSFNVSVPGATLLLKGGASALTILAPQAAGFRPGYHVGAGLLLRMDNRTGLRVDVIRHFYQDGGETEAIWSIGLGFTTLPRRSQ
jgi:hypothetical protein